MEKNSYNPDVLNCIANLSNDEVFTPPSLANRMLDILPPELFRSPDTTFLDPFSKSGVFLREIVKRLNKGLESVIPDRQQRIDHILHHQVFGIACTELTSLLSRRTLYCSRSANGRHSISHFDDEQGNLLYSVTKHTWANGKCKFCGASREVYDRGDEAEQYAYQFIHTNNPKSFFNMNFDVIIGNPPYQLTDGSGASSDAAIPVYHKFIEQALSLSPRFLSMIIPSKWMIGGRGLNKFREHISKDSHLKFIYDYEDASECFPGLHIDGGVCYFLRDASYSGLVHHVFKTQKGDIISTDHRLENDYFDFIIRDGRVISILDKFDKSDRFSTIVSTTKPYGIRKDLFNNPQKYSSIHVSNEKFPNSVKIIGVKGIKGGARRKIAYIPISFIEQNTESINKWKIFFTTSYSADAVNPPEFVYSEPNYVCTETFIVIGPFSSEEEMKNCGTYMKTSFFKALLYLGHGTMQVTRAVFGLIPLQDFSHPWTDEMLYKKYNLTQEEIDFIESMIKPIE